MFPTVLSLVSPGQDPCLDKHVHCPRSTWVGNRHLYRIECTMEVTMVGEWGWSPAVPPPSHSSIQKAAVFRHHGDEQL